MALFIKATVQDGARRFPSATIQPRFFGFFCVEIRLPIPLLTVAVTSTF